MDKITLENNKKNKRELAMLDKEINRLYEKLANVPMVSGKVSASEENFPYIERHVTVMIEEPKAATKIRKDINIKEARRKTILSEIEAVESFIHSMPEGEHKRIYELTYIEGLKQREVAEVIGLERSSISKKISEFIQLSHNSQK